MMPTNFFSPKPRRPHESYRHCDLSLASLGLSDITDVRQGKIFHMRLKDGLPPERTREQVERLAKEVLTNPVIEEYRVLWE